MLFSDFIEENAGGDGQIKRAGLPEHGNFNCLVGVLGDFGRYPVFFTAHDEEQGKIVCGLPVQGVCLDGGDGDVELVFGRPTEQLITSGGGDGDGEEGAHACFGDGGMACVCGVADEDDGRGVDGVGRAQDGAEVARIGDVGEGDVEAVGGAGELGKRPFWGVDEGTEAGGVVSLRDVLEEVGRDCFTADALGFLFFERFVGDVAGEQVGGVDEGGDGGVVVDGREDGADALDEEQSFALAVFFLAEPFDLFDEGVTEAGDHSLRESIV